MWLFWTDIFVTFLISLLSHCASMCYCKVPGMTACELNFWLVCCKYQVKQYAHTASLINLYGQLKLLRADICVQLNKYDDKNFLHFFPELVGKVF